jgi:hypothetical protein
MSVPYAGMNGKWEVKYCCSTLDLALLVKNDRSLSLIIKTLRVKSHARLYVEAMMAMSKKSRHLLFI